MPCTVLLLGAELQQFRTSTAHGRAIGVAASGSPSMRGSWVSPVVVAHDTPPDGAVRSTRRAVLRPTPRRALPPLSLVRPSRRWPRLRCDLSSPRRNARRRGAHHGCASEDGGNPHTQSLPRTSYPSTRGSGRELSPLAPAIGVTERRRDQFEACPRMSASPLACQVMAAFIVPVISRGSRDDLARSRLRRAISPRCVRASRCSLLTS